MSIFDEKQRHAGFREVSDVLKAFHRAGLSVQRLDEAYNGINVRRFKLSVVDEAAQRQLDGGGAVMVVFNTMSDTAKHMLVDLGLDNPNHKIVSARQAGYENAFYVRDISLRSNSFEA